MKNLVLFVNGIGAAFADAWLHPSVSIMALSAFIKTAGYRARVITPLMTDHKLQTLMADSACIGFSVLTGVGINQSLGFARRLRLLNRDIPMVWGGYHATLEPEQTLAHPDVDYVVRGEGEHTFLELLNALETDPPPAEAIAGLSYKSGEHIIHNSGRPACELISFPLPDYDLYKDNILRAKSLPYISSRGCPFDCHFCCNAAFNRTHGLSFRQLPVRRVLDDIETLLAIYKDVSLFFWDDLFLSTPGRIQGFLDGYEQHDFSFEWQAFGRCDIFARLSDNILARLKKSRLIKIFFGVESGSQDILDRINKRLKVSDVLRTAERLSQAGFVADFSFVCGFPNEDAIDVGASLELRRAIKRILPSASVRFFAYTPLPGTITEAECTRLGYIRPVKLEDWAQHEFHAFTAPWLSKEHEVLARNISYASLLEGLLPSSISSLKSAILYILSKLSAWRMDKGVLRVAPELSVVYHLHKRQLLSKVRQ